MATQEELDVIHQQRVERKNFNTAREEAIQARKEREAEEIQQQQNIADDPHTHLSEKEYGFGENVTELKNALLGGVRDTASSLLTAPERLVDMATGEMASDLKYKGAYSPDWDPFKKGGKYDPITKTWWGGLIRGGIHYGSMLIPVGGWASGAAKGTGALSKVAKVLQYHGKVKGVRGLRTMFSPHNLRAGAIRGAIGDTLSEYSQGPNLASALREKVPMLDTPLAVNDTDHPAMMTLKNVVEGMGIGIVVDGLWSAVSFQRQKGNLQGRPNLTGSKLHSDARNNAQILVGRNLAIATRRSLAKRKVPIDFDTHTADEQIQEMLKFQTRSGKYSTWTPPNESNIDRAARKINERRINVDDQDIEKAFEELKEPGFRARKNSPIANIGQGNSNSTSTPYDVGNQLRRIDTELGAEQGSTDGLISAAAIEALAETGLSKKGITPEIAKQLWGDARFQNIMETLKEKGQTLESAYGDSYARMQDLLGGRDGGAIASEDFWKPFKESVDQIGDFEAWSVENILATELTVSSIFKQLRDRALATRELKNIVNIDDIDGPLKNIHDNLVVGLENIDRAKYLMGDEYRTLVNQQGGKKIIESALNDIHLEAKQRVDMMFDLARQDPSDDLLHALVEAFSMSNKLQNWTDFDSFMREKLYGATTDAGKRQTGLIVKELQGVMVHSILSGPKTPIRAIMGTGTAVFTRPLSQLLGGSLRWVGSGLSDTYQIRVGLANINAIVQAVPDATEYFFSRLNSYWSGDISTIKSRFTEITRSDEHWALTEHWAETRGTAGDKAAFRIANMARSANNNNLLTYSTKLMAATDDAFTMILARARAKEKAMLKALEDSSPLSPAITPQVMRKFEDEFYSEIFDPITGSVNDSMLQYARGEATLTKDITGIAKSLDDLFQQYPAMRPFYLFARTGVNGLELSMKHAPGFNFLVKEFNDIAWASPDDLSKVAKYGIETAEDLLQAKSLQNGRLMLGSSVIFMVGQAYASGNVTGNGPLDPQLKRVWQSAGWIPRSIRIGDAWVSYDAFEPFSNIIAAVADLGDNNRLMGEEWHEKGMLTYAFLLAKGMVSKTYLQGIQEFMGIFSRDPKKLERVAAGLANNTMPLAGLRNEIGKFLNPHMKEIDSSFAEQMRNRNLYFEFAAGKDALATKYDVLNGRPIRDWSWPVRLFNAISPVQLNIDEDSPGRDFLRRSNFDLSVVLTRGPNGEDLTDYSQIRSEYQYALGSLNLEQQLNKLSKDRRIINSMNIMEDNLRRGDTSMPPSAYYHNQQISKLFRRARTQAWTLIQDQQEINAITEANQLEQESRKYLTSDPKRSRGLRQQSEAILNMRNK